MPTINNVYALYKYYYQNRSLMTDMLLRLSFVLCIIICGCTAQNIDHFSTRGKNLIALKLTVNIPKSGTIEGFYTFDTGNNSDHLLLKIWRKRTNVTQHEFPPRVLSLNLKLSANTSNILDSFPIIDGHNDMPYNILTKVNNVLRDFPFEKNLTTHPKFKGMHTDLPRLKQGKVGAQFWVAYVECQAQYKDAVATTLEQIDVIKRIVKKYPADMEFVTSADGILHAIKNKKIASLLAVEGGHMIDSRLSVLRMFYELGVRYLTLTHTCNTPWADSSIVDQQRMMQKGLTDFGKEVIHKMNRLGMLIDLSHTSKLVMDTAIEVSKAPVFFSHSSSYSVFNHPRNVHDDTLRRLKAKRGLIMINFYPGFIGNGPTNISTVVKHINYVANLIGPDHVGIGSDYDGIPSLPKGLEDVSKYPDLFEALKQSNRTLWTQENLEKVAGRNLIRVFKEAETVRDHLAATPPSEAWIPSVDLNRTSGNAWNCRTVATPLDVLLGTMLNTTSSNRKHG